MLLILTASWRSLFEKLAGNLMGPANEAGTGTTSEQSMSLWVFWPRIWSLAMAALNSDIMRSWSSLQLKVRE